MFVSLYVFGVNHVFTVHLAIDTRKMHDTYMNIIDPKQPISLQMFLGCHYMILIWLMLVICIDLLLFVCVCVLKLTSYTRCPCSLFSHCSLWPTQWTPYHLLSECFEPVIVYTSAGMTTNHTLTTCYHTNCWVTINNNILYLLHASSGYKLWARNELLRLVPVHTSAGSNDHQRNHSQ